MACIDNVLGNTGRNLVYLNKIFYSNENDSCPIIYDLSTTSDSFTQRLIIEGPYNACGCGNSCACGGGNNCACGCGNNCACGGGNNCACGCGNNCACGCGNNCACGCGNNCACGCGNNCACGCGNNCACGSGNNCACGCGCNSACTNFEINSNTQFTVTNTCAIITSILPGGSTPLQPSNVTVDGYPVTSLDFSDGIYIADLSGIMSEIAKCPCEPVDQHICHTCCTQNNCPNNCAGNGHFFLAEVDGPWATQMQITIEGIATNEGQSCRFKLCYNTLPQQNYQIIGSNNFAMYCVEIPCKTNGASPYIAFDFSACAVLLNPTLQVSTSSTSNDIQLAANLVITPSISMQVTRPSLFEINANEILTCCDNVGQCDPCLNSNCCCNSCVQGEIDCTSSPTVSNCNSCGGNNCQQPSVGVACQCCETNGYHF